MRKLKVLKLKWQCEDNCFGAWQEISLNVFCGLKGHQFTAKWLIWTVLHSMSDGVGRTGLSNVKMKWSVETKHTAQFGNHPHPLCTDLMNGSNQVMSPTEMAPYRPPLITLTANNSKWNIYILSSPLWSPLFGWQHTGCVLLFATFNYKPSHD